MGPLIDLLLTIDYVKENPTEVLLMAMLAIVVTLIACGYMAFRQHQVVWLSGGAGVILLLVGLIYLCGRLEPL